MSFDEGKKLGLALFADLYELTMAQAYDVESLDQQAVFELAFRTLPKNRNYAIAAGLENVLTALEQFEFSTADINYLRGLKSFSNTFLERLARTHFSGDVYALAEGTPVFPNEPIVQIVAPLVEGQLIETLLLNQIHFDTVAATKAARIVSAAKDRTVVDFGSRRAHGIDAATKVARASYLVGAAGTSLVLAGKQYGIPVFGTMAHSYIQAHDNEAEAFAAFARLYPETTILVDTYDTLGGVSHVVELSRRLGKEFRVRAIRLDSGELDVLARQSRHILDAAGLKQVQIFATNELDEHQIADYVAAGTPIDGFGVGTRLAVVDDAPHLDLTYKLVEYAGRGRIKLSTNKKLSPGRKQVFREFSDGRIERDCIGRHDEMLAGQPLLQCVMNQGRRTQAGQQTLASSRNYAMHQIQTRLPPAIRALKSLDKPYPVSFSPALVHDYEQLAKQVRGRSIPG